MSQRARHPPSDPSDKERKAYQKMLSEMEAHRDILRNIRNDLKSINLRNISNKEVERYQKQINEIIEYVVNSTIKNSDNKLIIYRFVKAVEAFDRTGNFIIREFNTALSRWEESHNQKLSVQRRNEAERAYQELLNNCRTELSKLLAVFKDF